MSYTIEQLFTRACSLVDSLKNDGTIDTNTTADYRGRTLTLIDMVQKELISVADIYKIYEVTRHVPNNMLGNGNYFNIRENDAKEDLIIECDNVDGVAKAYYFECDSGNGTAYIEDYTGAWNTLATITLNNTDLSFKAYSANVTATTGATKTRIRFSGSYYYNVVNLALYDTSFESGKIPVYRPWVPIQLPADVKTIDKVINEYVDKQYVSDSFYKIEWSGNRQTLYIDFYFTGRIRVQYKPITTVPTAFTDVVEIDDITAQAMCYFLAMNLVATEQNEYLTGLFRNQYERLKGEARIKQPMGTTDIIDFYGGG